MAWSLWPPFSLDENGCSIKMEIFCKKKKKMRSLYEFISLIWTPPPSKFQCPFLNYPHNDVSHFSTPYLLTPFIMRSMHMINVSAFSTGVSIETAQNSHWTIRIFGRIEFPKVMDIVTWIVDVDEYVDLVDKYKKWAAILCGKQIIK